MPDLLEIRYCLQLVICDIITHSCFVDNGFWLNEGWVGQILDLSIDFRCWPDSIHAAVRVCRNITKSCNVFVWWCSWISMLLHHLSVVEFPLLEFRYHFSHTLWLLMLLFLPCANLERRTCDICHIEAEAERDVNYQNCWTVLDLAVMACSEYLNVSYLDTWVFKFCFFLSCSFSLLWFLLSSTL